MNKLKNKIYYLIKCLNIPKIIDLYLFRKQLKKNIISVQESFEIDKILDYSKSFLELNKFTYPFNYSYKILNYNGANNSFESFLGGEYQAKKILNLLANKIIIIDFISFQTYKIGWFKLKREKKYIIQDIEIIEDFNFNCLDLFLSTLSIEERGEIHEL